MTTIDMHALREKYAAERTKRLRPDGIDQYLQFTGRFADMLADPHAERVEREPRRDHVTFAFIGGGFAGLITGARLRETGIADVRIVEKGGDFGGTWYWNRYPGAQCDTASMIYLPFLEETGHMPSERYVHAPEILEHCQRIARHYGLYENALFDTRVTDLEWDESALRWIVQTDRGDEFTAQFVGWGTGTLDVPKLPAIPGIETFAGRCFHTSRWDYEYTGGDPVGTPPDKLRDKRVAIIGTGATAVQCVPSLADVCRELFVFQRTPSSVDLRGNRPIDTEWFAQVATPGWQQRWLENFVANMVPSEEPSEDLINDGWTDLAKRIRSRLHEPDASSMTPEQLSAEIDVVEFGKMSEIRARVDARVADRQTAERLKAWYRMPCKRPCFHDEYLDAYNKTTVHLVDTDGRGVERITPRGVVVAGTEYQVDCIVYASGFEVGTAPTRRAGFDVTGRGGVRLSEYWTDGMHSMHGIHVHGFPNVFLVHSAGGASFMANVPHNLAELAKSVVAVVGHALDNGYGMVEVTKQAQDAWKELAGIPPGMRSFWESCTPGYYNNEGGDLGPYPFDISYVDGPVAFFRYLQEWRDNGKFEGLEFSQSVH
jgi:cation diffusion facilitator CzcD-associated flavoprotein CzcO